MPPTFSHLPFCLFSEHTTREDLRDFWPEISTSRASVIPSHTKSFTKIQVNQVIGSTCSSLCFNIFQHLSTELSASFRWVRQVRWFTQPGKGLGRKRLLVTCSTDGRVTIWAPPGRLRKINKLQVDPSNFQIGLFIHKMAYRLIDAYRCSQKWWVNYDSSSLTLVILIGIGQVHLKFF